MVTVTGLTKHFGKTRAVNNISFHIDKGEIVAFLDPNGAGKTTTMRMLTGYLPPTAGSCQINSIDVADKPDRIKQWIGYLPEDNPLYPEMKVYEYLEFVGQVRKIAHLRERMKDVSLRCGIGDVIGKKISVLSRGYRQRVTKKTIAGDSIHRILIERLRDTTEILISDQGMFVNPGEYRGDTNEINALITQLRQATLGEVISERREMHARFGVDEGALRVTLNGKPSQSFYVGGRAADYLRTYVRFIGDDDVYLAEGIFREMFDRDPDEWRDALILTFDMDAVDKIVINDLGFMKRDTRWFLHEREIEPIKVIEVLNLLSNLRAIGFADNVSVFEPVLTVSIMSDAFTYGVEIGEKQDRFLYLLRVTGHKPVFLVNEYIIDQILGLLPDT